MICTCMMLNLFNVKIKIKEIITVPYVPIIIDFLFCIHIHSCYLNTCIVTYFVSYILYIQSLYSNGIHVFIYCAIYILEFLFCVYNVMYTAGIQIVFIYLCANVLQNNKM